jgi:hypothetical protein
MTSSESRVNEQAMPELGEEDRTLVLDYLAANFGPGSRQP